MRKREFKPNKGHDKENAEVIKTVPDLVKKNASENQLHGVIPILETLRAGTRSIEKLLIAEGVKHHRLHELLALSRASNVPIQRTSRIDLDRMVPNGATHQGVIAIVSSANYHNTEDLLESLISKIGTDDQPLVVVLDGVEDPRNLGAIIRTAECAGAHAIFIPERRQWLRLQPGLWNIYQWHVLPISIV
jgi:tRNA G18 (ribose-2'-O)-methylase SpoU